MLIAFKTSNYFVNIFHCKLTHWFLLQKVFSGFTLLNALNGLQLISKFLGNHDMQINLRNHYNEV